jgi:hypothetical protein
VAPANNTSPVPLVHVQGIAGELTGLGIAGGMAYHRFRLTLDGHTLADDYLVGRNTAGASGNAGMGLSLPFESELKVEVYDELTASAITRFWAAFLTSHARTEPEESIAVRRIAGKEYRIKRTSFSRPDAPPYTVDELLGAAHLSRVRLDSDTYFRGELLRGSLDLEHTEHLDYTPTEESVRLFVRPIGRTRDLLGLELDVVRGERIFEFATGDLPPRMELELAADLADYGNVPASFVVL